MSLNDYDYDLPAELIAQAPREPRDAARLLVLPRHAGPSEHRLVRDLPDLLAPGDLLVLNDTRVVPARLLGRRAATGGKWEGLFLHETADGLWELLSQTRGRLRPGERIAVEPGPLTLVLQRQTPERRWLARPDPPGPAFALLARHGHTPLPPYIRKGRAGPGDRERYQTVYAARDGSVAAPTAGLHFTPELLDRLDDRGVARAFVTLHVGAGTFAPITAPDVARHRMHHEWGRVPEATAAAAAACRARGGRVVAVGTTTVRVLETAALGGALGGALVPWQGETDLFIRPGHTFRAVDALVTNFHLPRSTLLCLVSAFAGRERVLAAYAEAVAGGYHFYSYGDAMFLA